MQYSQEHLKTMVYAKFGEQTECIMGNWKIENCFLFRFVCIELVSLIWFLQIWVAIYVKGTMVNWSTLVKKFMQTYIVIVSGSILNVSTQLTPQMTLSIETC